MLLNLNSVYDVNKVEPVGWVGPLKKPVDSLANCVIPYND